MEKPITDEQFEEIVKYQDQLYKNVRKEFKRYLTEQLGKENKDLILAMKDLLSPISSEKTKMRAYNWLVLEGWFDDPLYRE